MDSQIKNTDEYIASFEGAVRERLSIIRRLMLQQVPASTEAIKYGMPTVIFRGKNMIHFAAFKNHIGIFPGPATIVTLAGHLKNLKTSKGTIQIPHKMDLPVELIKLVVETRNSEMLLIPVKKKRGE